MDQTTYSNSKQSGIGTGTPAQTTKSKGTPTFTSDASKTAIDMVWTSSTATTANPLSLVNYNQSRKWGTVADKWTAGTSSSEEKGANYEGEKLRKKLINAGSYLF